MGFFIGGPSRSVRLFEYFGAGKLEESTGSGKDKGKEVSEKTMAFALLVYLLGIGAVIAQEGSTFAGQELECDADSACSCDVTVTVEILHSECQPCDEQEVRVTISVTCTGGLTLCEDSAEVCWESSNTICIECGGAFHSAAPVTGWGDVVGSDDCTLISFSCTSSSGNCACEDQGC